MTGIALNKKTSQVYVQHYTSLALNSAMEIDRQSMKLVLNVWTKSDTFRVTLVLKHPHGISSQVILIISPSTSWTEVATP